MAFLFKYNRFMDIKITILDDYQNAVKTLNCFKKNRTFTGRNYKL